MFKDLIAAIKAGAREFRRLRWVKQRIRQITLPF